MAELVVPCLLVIVDQDLVRFGDLLELLLCCLDVVLVHVGMVLHRELSVGLLDLVLRGPSLHAEYLIVVPFLSHSSVLLGLWALL
jgi:hypothetical protein